MAVTSLASIAMTCPPLKEEAIAHLISIFETKFCLPRGRPNDPLVVKPNHFDNFPNYFLQKWIPQVLSHIKTDGGKCPIEIQRFLLHLLRYNDNTMNPFSDSFYIATLIQSLTESLIPSTVDPRCKPDTILLKDAIAEIERYRFLDLVEPSYHNQVTISILQASVKLQHSGLLLVDLNLFWQYWKPQNYLFVRQTAIEALLLLSPPSIAPSQMSEAEMLSHVLKWLLFIRNIYCTDQESIQCTSSNSNQDIEGCLGCDWLRAETVNNFVGRPLMIKLIIDSLKKSIMVSTKISQVFVKDETCKYLLKMLFKKVLASGRLELIEPILLICRIGLPAAPVPEIDH